MNKKNMQQLRNPHWIVSVLACVITACAADTTPDAPPVQLVRSDGSYATVPLEKEEVVLKVVQNGVRNLQDFPSVREGLAFNLERMLEWIDRACTQGDKPDIILFNEFPLTGYSSGTRDEKLAFTLTIPGPETDAVGAAARACDSYIVFGSYARDDDWPGHILSINTVVDRAGKIAQKFWKTRNVKRLSADREIPTTTVENVRDRYRAMYGVEAEFPVLRTEYGNLAVSTVQLDAFVYAAFAMRGVEIMLRTSTVFAEEDVKAMARFNNFYTAMSNITFPPEASYAHWGGNSLIVAPDGKVLAQDPSNNENIISARLEIAKLRENRRIPSFPLEVVQPVFEQYQSEIPLNHLDVAQEELPKTGADMKTLLDDVSRYEPPSEN